MKTQIKVSCKEEVMKTLLMIGPFFIVLSNLCMNNDKLELWKVYQEKNFTKWTNDYLNRIIDVQLTTDDIKSFEERESGKFINEKREILTNEKIVCLSLKKLIDLGNNLKEEKGPK